MVVKDLHLLNLQLTKKSLIENYNKKEKRAPCGKIYSCASLKDTESKIFTTKNPLKKLNFSDQIFENKKNRSQKNI